MQHAGSWIRRSMPRPQDADHLTGTDDGADPDRRDNRLVCRSELAVDHDDDASPGQHAGERNHPRASSNDLTARRGGQIDPAMTGAPANRRWIEGPDHMQRLRQRRCPSGRRRTPDRGSDEGSDQGCGGEHGPSLHRSRRQPRHGRNLWTVMMERQDHPGRWAGD